MMNIFWAPKSSNKKLYNFKNKNWKKRFGKPKKWKTKLNFLDIKKFKKFRFFGWQKKFELFGKKFKKFREFFWKKSKMELFELLELFDFFDF